MSTISNNSNEMTNLWMQYEKTRNGCKARPNNPLATYTEFPEKYRPEAPSYTIPVYEIPKDKCLIFRSHFPDLALENHYLHADRVQFPVHPINLMNHKIPHIEDIAKHTFQECRVEATASTRTVFVHDEKLPPHCLKLHTDLYITRWKRHMEKRRISHAIAITELLEQSTLFKEGKIGFFPESLGIIYGKENAKDWGVVIREMRSKPYLEENYQMIPLNALYNVSSINPKNDPLVVEMIYSSKKSPYLFLMEEIIEPLLAGWAKIYLETGVLLEPHGQNAIVEISTESGTILRFSHRDFDCEVNKEISLKNGYNIAYLNQNELFTNEDDNWAPQGARLSIIFDNSLRVPLEELANIGLNYFNIPKETLREGCRDFLEKTFPELKEHFPKNGKMYNYKKEEDILSIEEIFLENSWRSLEKLA